MLFFILFVEIIDFLIGIKTLNRKEKIRVVSELASIVFHTYLQEEFDNVTQKNHQLKKNKQLLKEFFLHDFPFTVDMINKLQKNKNFKNANPKLNMDQYLYVVDNVVCNSLGK